MQESQITNNNAQPVTGSEVVVNERECEIAWNAFFELMLEDAIKSN